MVRTKNAPTKQIVGGLPDSHLVEAMGVEQLNLILLRQKRTTNSQKNKDMVRRRWFASNSLFVI